MDVFESREKLITDYSDYVRGFITIRDHRISDTFNNELNNGYLWPDPYVQLNPAYERGVSIEELVLDGTFHSECKKTFDAINSGRLYKSKLDPLTGPPLNPDGTFAELLDWPAGTPKPSNWPSHVHEPRRD